MALIVLCDPKYRHGVWCDAKLRGITDEASRRRIQPQIFTNISAAVSYAEKCDGESSVILLFDSVSWMCKATEALSVCRTHVILSANFVDIPLPVSYSLVGTDVDAAMRTAVDYLHSCGKRRVALVGANTDSCNDRSRVTMLKKYLSPEECKIYYVDVDMLDCFDEFLKEQDSFDAAFCTNDFLAICLEECMKEHPRSGERLFIISHTDTVMSRLYGDGITSVTTNFYDCGRMLVETHFNRLKFGVASSAMLLPAELKIRGSTCNIPYLPSRVLPAPLQNEPASAPKQLRLPTGEIGRLERMLASSDLVNLKLIYCLLCGFNYERMSEFCFISAETARYRVRRIRTALGVQKRAEVAELIRTYVKKESLLAIIAEQEEKNNRIIV